LVSFRCFAVQPAGGAVVPDDYDDIFSHMPRLVSVELDEVYGIDQLLTHLQLAPALRHISIGVVPRSISRCLHDAFPAVPKPVSVPCPAVLGVLLLRLPQLQVRLYRHRGHVWPDQCGWTPSGPQKQSQVETLMKQL